MPRLGRLAVRVGLLAALGLAGCKPAVREAASEVPQAAAEGSVEAVEDQRLRQRIASAMETPELQRAIAELASGLSKGAVAGLSDEEAQRRMQAMVTGLTRALVTSLAPALRQAIVDDLGPALRESLDKDLAPGVAAMLRQPAMQDAIGTTGHELGRQAVLGSNAALAALEHEKRADRPSGPLGAMVAFFGSRTWLLMLLALAVVFALPMFWLLKERSSARRYRAEAERRAAEAHALIRAIDAAQGSPFSNELLRLLGDVFADARWNEKEERGPPSSRPPSRAAHA